MPTCGTETIYRLAAIVLILAAATLAFPLPAVRAQVRADQAFPMRPGTYWIYRGTVKWTEPNSADVREQVIDWKMEIVGLDDFAPYLVASVKGSPDDLVWYSRDKPRGDYAIVKNGGKYYRLGGSIAAEWQAHLNADTMFADIPFRPGTCLGIDVNTKRDNATQCWFVQGASSVQLLGVKGIPSNRKFTSYKISYLDNTSHTYFDFVPGVGMTSYLFGHHGTVSEVDVKLVEFHPG